MDYIRSIVSGKKKRYIEEGYNLDLSYITPRIIAMSLPGEGITKLYRNNLDMVSSFLESRYKNRYQIYNLSGIPYNYEKFSKIKEFPWPDHYPPPIDLLFRACRSIEEWLKEDILNVIVVHCRAGKGRTGTLICSYLLYSGKFNEAESALKYYQAKRFKEGGGVTQPSQVRYVKYFFDILQGNIKSPLILKPVLMQFRTAPHISDSSCKPIVEIYYENIMIYSSKQNERDCQIHLMDDWEDRRLHTVVLFNSCFMQGDILCKIYHWGKYKVSDICRFSFNTGFVPYNKILVLRKYELDPTKFSESSLCSEYFSVILTFEQICECKSGMEVDERCEFCLKMLTEKEKKVWKEICWIVKNRDIGNMTENLYGIGEDDSSGVIKEFENSLDEQLKDDYTVFDRHDNVLSNSNSI